MNPLEEHLGQLPLPEIPNGMRDRMLLETGRQLGKREARSWKGVSLALGMLLGLSWLPNLQSLSTGPKPDPLNGNAPSLANHNQPKGPPVLEQARPAPPENDYSQWVFDWFVPDLSTTKKLELLHASRLDQIDPIYPPVWATTMRVPQPIESITTIIPSEDR